MKTQTEYQKEIQLLAKRIALKAKVFAADSKNKNAEDLAYVLGRLKEADQFLCVDIAKYL